MATVLVVRFAGTGLREYHELGLCIPATDDDTVRVIYADREVICKAYEMQKALDVDVQTMLCKAHVRNAVERDLEALRSNVSGYDEVRSSAPYASVVCVRDHPHTSRGICNHMACVSAQVFATVHENIEQVHAILSTHTARRSRQAAPATEKRNAADLISNFITLCPEDARFVQMSSNVSHFRGSSQTLMPTSWVKTAPVLAGMQRINLKHAATMRKVRLLCKKKNIAPPSNFVLLNSFHYGKYSKKKLVSVLSLSVMNLNKTPGSVAICIDIAASSDPDHSMTIALDSLKKMMRKRRNTCVLFAQVANTESACKFWEGKLSKTKRASVMPVLFAMFDDRYTIYEDTSDMAFFYE